MADTAAVSKEEPEGRTPQDISSYWQVQLELADKEHKEWIDAGDKVVKRYKSEKNSALRAQSRKFNILYSNTEVLRAALYGKAAKPDVRRRFAERDVVARTAADVVERSLIFCAETYDVDRPIEAGVLDYLLPGRAVIRVEYEPVIKQRPVIDPMTMQPVVGEDDDPQTEDYIADQKLRERYVYWKDFLCSSARNWDQVCKSGWIAFRHTMTREQLRHNKFENADTIPLNWQPTIEDRRKVSDDQKKAEVWEIWNAEDRNRIWIVKGFPQPCRTDDDPYGLEGFYPIPEPPTSYLGTDSLIPNPEYHAYQDQAEDLDEITSRISRLTKALKRRGVYNQAIKELARLSNAADNQFIPVENYAALSDKGGLQAAFQTEDIKVIAEVLSQLYLQRDQLVQAIYEVTGIADIMRGNSDPSETLGAQQLKAQFGSARLKRRQRAIQKWIRDIYKLKAEIIAEHFEPQVLQEMTGQQIGPEVMQLLRSDKLRSYRIDIETDSTIFEDAEAEKKSRTELVVAVTQFMEGWGPIVQQQPMLMPLAFELLTFALKGFKAGRAVEDAIEQAKMQLEQTAQQPKPPDPKVQAEQAKLQVIQQKGQMDMQAKAADVQGKQALNQQELEIKREELQIKREELALKREEIQMKLAADRQQASLDDQAMQRQARMDEQSAALGAEAMTQKHDLGLEMMAAKAKQANKPRASVQ